MEHRHNKNQLMLMIFAVIAVTAILNLGNLGKTLESLLLAIPGLFLAITVHEFGHALLAYKFGDKANKKRMTLNPLKHIDPVGLASLALVHVGWGKPVVVDKNSLKNTKMSVELKESIISLAGPVFNFLTVIVLDIILIKILLPMSLNTGIAYKMFEVAIILNISLGIFNLLPIPPLDGYNIIKPMLPKSITSYVRNNMEIISLVFIALLILLPSSFISSIIGNLGDAFQLFVLNLIG